MIERYTTDVVGWAHGNIQDEKIESAVLPLGFRIDPDAIPAAISKEAAQTLSPSQHELFQVSPHHGRSYEVGPNVDTRSKMSRLAIWQDQYNNNYTSVSLKGNNFSTHRIMESATAPSGYIPMGLQESDSLYRIVKASRLLRERGIPTEWIHGVYEPQQLVFNDELVSQAAYKKRLLDHTMHQFGLEEAVKVAQAIEPMTFFVTERSMMINDRLTDLIHDTPEQARQRLRHVFHIGNKLFENNDDFKKLLPSRPQDRDHFFGAVYPTLLGRSMAALHDSGLVHTFPTLSNTTLLGGIIDLDSVKGAPLEIGDKDVTASDLLDDLTTITNYQYREDTLRNHYKELERLSVIRSFGVYAYAEYMFVSSYLEHRAPTTDKQEKAVRELISLGASQLPDNDAAEAHALLTTDEAARLQTIIEEAYKKNFEEIFCKENIETAVHISIDGVLEEKFNAAPVNEDGLSKIRISAKEADDIVDDVLEEMGHVFSFKVNPFDSSEDFNDPLLATHFPDKSTRELLYQELYVKYRELQLEKPETAKAKDTLRDAIQEEIHQQLTNLVAKFTISDADNYHKYVTDFSGEINANSASVVWFKGKAIYGYDGVDLTTLLNRAVACNIDVVVDVDDEFRPLYDDPTDIPREAYTNAPKIELTVAAEARKSIPGAFLSRKSIDDDLYLAWLCEPKTPEERPSLHVTHEDPAVLLLALAQLSSSDVKFTI